MAAIPSSVDNVLNDRRAPPRPDSGLDLLKETGYEVELVDPGSRDNYECPVCLGVLRDPYLNDCCGHHFCKACIKMIQLGNGICPLCKENGFNIFPNLKLKRVINELQVKCVNEKHGCHWQGELRQLVSTHQGDCEFAVKPCPYECGHSFSKLAMAKHEDDCPNLPVEVIAEKVRAENRELRTLVSELKRNHETALKEIETLKQQVNELQPLMELVKSVKEECAQLQEVTAACNNKQELLNAEQKKAEQALNKHRTRLQELHQQMNNDAAAREAEVTKLQECLDDVGDIARKLQPTVTQVLGSSERLPPIQLVMKDFSAHKAKHDWWHSEPFYTHICGYKMHLEVKASGNATGKGTHVSVYVHLMKGENDANLAWPVGADVAFKLLNQHTAGENDIESKVSFVPGNAAANRVLDGKLAGTGRGYAQFVTHPALNFDPIRGIQYLKDDCLQFEVVKIVSSYSN